MLQVQKQMPNRKYEKGRRKEWKIVKEEKEKGAIAFRSAGSHSPVDVVSISPETRRIYLIQCKPDSMPESQKKKIEEENKNLNCVFEVKFIVV